MRYLRILALLLLFSACEKKSPTAAALSGRLEAAKSILDVDARNDALARLVDEAAKANSPALTKEALEAMADVDGKSNAAEKASRTLSKLGETEAATEIAKLISDTDTRNRALEAIAKGS